jgi:hypothetical protein
MTRAGTFTDVVLSESNGVDEKGWAGRDQGRPWSWPAVLGVSAGSKPAHETAGFQSTNVPLTLWRQA